MPTNDSDDFIVFTQALVDKPAAYIAGGNDKDFKRSYYYLTEDVGQAQAFKEGNARQVAADLNRGEPEIGIGVVPGSENRRWYIAPKTSTP